jgi:hypothetical protein
MDTCEGSAATPQDGWDLDCDWDSALLSPDANMAGRQGPDPAAGAPPTDQCWVGFGPTSDIRSAPSAAASGGNVAKLGLRQSGQPLVSYPDLQHPNPGCADSADAAQCSSSVGSNNSRQLAASPGSRVEDKPGADIVRLPSGGSSCPANKGPVITADSSWEEVQQALGDGGRATIHSRGFASNPFGPTLVYGYRGVAFEVLKNGHLAGLTLFEA